MASKKAKEAAQAYVRLFPVIDNLAKNISKEIDKSANGVNQKGKEIGKKLADGVNKGLKGAKLDNLSKQLNGKELQRGLAKTVSGAGGLIMKPLKGIGSVIGTGVSKGLNLAARTALKPFTLLGNSAGRSVSRGINNGLGRINRTLLTRQLGGASIGQSILGGVSRAISFSLKPIRAMGSLAGRSIATGIQNSAGLIKNSIQNTGSVALTGLGTVAAAGLGVAISKGFSRALSMTEARAKIRGLGYEGENLEKIMKAASDSVDGLAFSTGDAASASAGLLAAGVKPGEDLRRVLRSIGDTASLTGREFGDISTIYGKVFASGIVQGEELNQLMDAGVPILSYLSKTLGVTTKEVRKLASEGKVSSEDFAKAMEKNLGGVGERMAKFSFKLSAKNVLSQVGRILEPVFTTILESAIPVLGTLRNKLKEIVKLMAPILEPIQDKVKDVFSKIEKDIEGFNFSKTFTKAKSAISNFEGALLPIAGLIAGSFGKSLSGIPILGGLFRGLSGPVGLVAGFFVKMWQSSEKLRKSFSNLKKRITEFTDALFSVNKRKFDFTGIFKTAGDKLSVGIDKISKVIQDKGDKMRSVLDKMWTQITNKKTGETLGKAADGLFTGISALIGTGIDIVIELATDPRLRLAFSQLIESLTGAFKSLGQLSEGENAASLGQTLASVGAIILSGISVFIGVVTEVSKSIAKIVASPAFKTFASWVKGIAQVFTNNAGLMKAAIVGAIAILAGIKIFRFVSMITGPLIALMKIKAITGALKGNMDFGAKIGKLIRNIGKGIASGFRAIPGIAQAFVQATPHIMLAIGAAALIIAELALLGFLMEKLNVSDGLKDLGTVLGSLAGVIITVLKTLVSGIVDIIVRNAPIIAAGIAKIFIALKPVADFVLEAVRMVITSLITILQTVVLPILQTIVQSISGILNGLANVIRSVGSVITAIFNGIANVFKTFFSGISQAMLAFAFSTSMIVSSLVNGGMEAAAAAIALAGGISALALAMAGGSLAQGAAGIGTAITDFGKGAIDFMNPFNNKKKGKNEEAPQISAVDQIIALVDSLKTATQLISTLQTNWNLVALQALTAGGLIVSNLANGITMNSVLMSMALAGAISLMLSQAQNQLNANPLQVRVNTPSSLTAAGIEAGFNYSGNTSKHQNNTFNIQNPNPLVAANAIENLLR